MGLGRRGRGEEKRGSRPNPYAPAFNPSLLPEDSRRHTCLLGRLKIRATRTCLPRATCDLIFFFFFLFCEGKRFTPTCRPKIWPAARACWMHAYPAVPACASDLYGGERGWWPHTLPPYPLSGRCHPLVFFSLFFPKTPSLLPSSLAAHNTRNGFF